MQQSDAIEPRIIKQLCLKHEIFNKKLILYNFEDLSYLFQLKYLIYEDRNEREANVQ